MLQNIQSFKRRRLEENTSHSSVTKLPFHMEGSDIITCARLASNSSSSSRQDTTSKQLTLDQAIPMIADSKTPPCEGTGSASRGSAAQGPSLIASLPSNTKIHRGEVNRVIRQETPTLIRNGVIIRLRDLQAHELSFLQKSLTYYPPSAFDKSAPVQPVLAYKMDADVIIIPRMLGMKYYPSGTNELSMGETLSPEISFTGTLKSLQIEVAKSAITKLQRPPYGAVLTLPCGFGKTVLGLFIAYTLQRRTLIVVHKEFLLNQWMERIQAFLPAARIGILQGPKEDMDNDFVIAMVQTLTARTYPVSFFDGFGTLIADECHHYASRCFSLIFFNNRIRHVVGLSATPKRKDGLTELVHAYLGDFAANIEEGTGTTSRSCRILRIKYDWGKRRNDELSPAMVQRIKGKLVQDPQRNQIISNCLTQLAATRRKVIVLSERINHLESLHKGFHNLRSKRSSSLYIGATKSKDRDEAAKADVIFASFALAAEGLDIPELDTLILATPFSDVTQSIGRILRQSPSKQSPLVIDIVDDHCTAFDRNANARSSLYRRCDYNVVTCASQEASSQLQQLLK